MSDTVRIFADGSSLGNPGPGGWGAIVVVDGEVAELGAHEAHTTNNRMELSAAIAALEHLDKLGASHIGSERRTIEAYTDSRYVINGITKWVHGWKKNDWKTATKDDVSNRDLWQRLDELARRHDISWQYVPGHSGVPGNERVDEIATSYAALAAGGQAGDEPGLYAGPLTDYDIDILRLAPTIAKVRTKSGKGAKAYSYLSLVDGQFHRDTTWAACEARVKGKKGAKYKKALSAEDEASIMKEWKVDQKRGLF